MNSFTRFLYRRKLDIEYASVTHGINKKIRERRRESKREKEKEMEKAAEYCENPGFSKEILEGIDNTAGNNLPAKFDLFTKAKITDKLKFYTIYYMTNRTAKLIKLNEKEMELVNGIAELAGFGKIYESADIADLRKYDPKYELYNEGHLFLLSIDDISLQVNTTEVQKKISSKKAFLGKGGDPNAFMDTTPEFVVNSEEIHPINFSINPSAYQHEKVDMGITREEKRNFDKTLKDYIVEKKWRYVKDDGGMVTLYQEDPSGIESAMMIDMYGYIMGGEEPAILANTMINGSYDTTMVPLNYDNQDLVKEIFKNPFFIVPQEDVEKINQRYLKDMSVYRFIDMQNTGWIKQLSEDDKNILSGKLLFVINHFYSNGQLPCRMRFESYNSPQDFKLISDDKCLSPLAILGSTETTINNGLEIHVEGNNITVDFIGVKDEYQIPA